MGSPPVLELDQLLAPVSPDGPGGTNLRWDPLYDEIKQARREDSRDALDAGGVQANWALVVEKARDALARRSKDLMLAGYLTEALVQLHGFAGLRDGLRVVSGLLETCWDHLYPEIDGDDLEPRAAPIVWMTEADRGARLPSRVREIALTPSAPEGVVYSWAFWKSRFVQPKGDSEDESAFARRRAEAEGRAKAFEDAVAAVPVAYYRTLRDDVEECLAEVARLGTVLDRAFGRAAPGTSALRQALEECRVLVLRVLKDKGGLEPEAAAAADAAAVPEDGAGASSALPRGPIGSRTEALRRLAEIAAFFRQTEPHSPISHLVERAVAWGAMPFERLLDELVKDSSVREQIGELLGLNRRTEG
jgi:type VI secretion system protein ImpA